MSKTVLKEINMQYKIEGHKFNQKHKQIAQKTNWLNSLKEKFEKM